MTKQAKMLYETYAEIETYDEILLSWDQLCDEQKELWDRMYKQFVETFHETQKKANYLRDIAIHIFLMEKSQRDAQSQTENLPF